MDPKLTEVSQLFERFKAACTRDDLNTSTNQLSQLKVLLTGFRSLPPLFENTPDADKELTIARDVYEHAVLLSVKIGDQEAFERNFFQLKPYYTDAGSCLPQSPQEYMILGLNLLRLLVQNRIAEFHTELELLSPTALEDPCIKHAVELEQSFMEGAYNRVLSAKHNVPYKSYDYFMDLLAKTVRGLLFPSENELLEYIKEEHPEWEIKNGSVVFQKAKESAPCKEIPSLQLINQTLSYARELERITSSSTVNGPQEPSNHDELFMKQSLLFSDTLEDLKNLRKQLYSAADYFELAYYKEDQNKIAVETLKDYAIKALVSTVDHLGSVADNTNRYLDQKIGEVSEMGLPDEESMDAYSRTKSNYHSRSPSTEQNLLELNNAVHATIKGAPSSIRGRHSKSQFPQLYSRQGTFTITRTSNNSKPERRSSSPHHFPLIRSGSPLKRPVSSNYTDARTRRRYPSEPRRSVSLSTYSERDMAKDSEQQNSGKSKRLFKALLSMRKSRKEGSMYKYLDEI
uniref:CSN8/PSMD8/EIF3K domain-containing protein n=1 Tax=Salix viminalis TaxID=40686 RepID=A0A6N2JZX1_SALVM